MLKTFTNILFHKKNTKPLKSEAIHEIGLSGNVVASFFPLIIFILLCFNVLSTVPRENRLADFLYIYIYIYIMLVSRKADQLKVKQALFND